MNVFAVCQVMVHCTIWNPNNNVVAYSYYAVEFLPSGKVMPNEPIIAVAPWNSNNIYSVDIALVFAYYYLTEELSEFIEGAHCASYMCATLHCDFVVGM